MPILKDEMDPISKSRITFSVSLTKKEIKRLRKNKDLECLQFSGPVEQSTFSLLNTEFFSKRPDVELRAYGFYSQVCDLKFISEMANLRRFSADCLRDATGLEHLSSIEKLESLRVGVYNLDNFDFLKEIDPNIKELRLCATKSKKPDIKHLSRFKFLETIYLEGQQKNIEVLSDLLNLKDVTLRSISAPGIDYLKPLKKMWSLDIKLGGIKDLTGIESMNNIKYLELWQIKGLSDITVISTLEGLQYLFLQSLKQITTLPSFDRLYKLRRICLENMKGLGDIKSLKTAPALREYCHVDASNIPPEDFLPLLENQNLKKVSVGFGSGKRNSKFCQLMKAYGIREYIFSPFKFD